PREVADHLLARHARDDRIAVRGELRQRAEKLPVVLDRLAEAEARVDRDSIARDARLLQRARALEQEPRDLGHHVVVAGLLLHRAGRALHVHHHHCRLRVRDRIDRTLTAQSVHIVHHGAAGSDRRAHDVGLHRVHRDRDTFLRERFHHRNHPAHFFLDRDGLRARPRRLAAHVDQVGALVAKREAVRDRLRSIEEPPAIGERIRRDVHDAHHEGTGRRKGKGASHGFSRAYAACRLPATAYAFSTGVVVGSAARPPPPLSGGGTGLATGLGGRGGLPPMMSLIWSASMVSHSSSALVITSTLSRFSSSRRRASAYCWSMIARTSLSTDFIVSSDMFWCVVTWRPRNTSPSFSPYTSGPSASVMPHSVTMRRD